MAISHSLLILPEFECAASAAKSGRKRHLIDKADLDAYIDRINQER
jgi:hypothetical protein